METQTLPPTARDSALADIPEFLKREPGPSVYDKVHLPSARKWIMPKWESPERQRKSSKTARQLRCLGWSDSSIHRMSISEAEEKIHRGTEAPPRNRPRHMSKKEKAMPSKKEIKPKQTRGDVTIEMLKRTTGVTKDELAEAFEKKFGSGKPNTVTAALSKAPKGAGYKVVKEKTKKRGVVYRIAA
tara:strand:- start:568 stop:1125 length:558 start_codon:yes stop_codon:yes gene_type:complete